MGSRRVRNKGIGTTIQLTAEHEHDFWARVDRSEEGGCWIWTGSVNKDSYPTVRIGNERVGAPRVAWVLHHQKALPSYQQVRRRCKCSKCVRPTHMVRSNTSYSKYASRGGKTSYTLLKPPVGGKTEAPRRETVVALSGSFQELQKIRAALHALTAALPQTDSNQQKAHEKTQTYITQLTSQVESLREEMVRWTANVDQRLVRMQRSLDAKSNEAEPEPEPEPSQPAAEPVPVPRPVPQSVNGKKPEKMAAVLMSAFQAQLGGPREPTDEDYDSLDMVFDIALQEAQDPSAAVEQFGAWLSSFHALSVSHPSLEATPQGFAREVAARRLEAV